MKRRIIPACLFGNGVSYMVREFDKLPIWRSAPEYQVLDNVNHLDARLGKNGNRQSASLYDLIPAEPKTVKAGANGTMESLFSGMRE
jgi:hypothetical protein